MRSLVIASHGQFNFLMSDGPYLIAYGHDRLRSLTRTCEDQRLVLLCHQPLAENDPWQSFATGELHVYRGGERAARLSRKYTDKIIQAGTMP